MTDYTEYRAIKKLEEEAGDIGLRLVPSKHGYSKMALIPLENKLPIYSRDTEIVAGTIEHLQSFVSGWKMAFCYYSSLKLISNSKIDNAENKILQDRLALILKGNKDK